MNYSAPEVTARASVTIFIEAGRTGKSDRAPDSRDWQEALDRGPALRLPLPSSSPRRVGHGARAGRTLPTVEEPVWI